MSKEDNRVNPYPIRLTVELREKLEKAAKAGSRSLNAEMLLRLEASFGDGEVQLTEARVIELIREEFIKLSYPNSQ